MSLENLEVCPLCNGKSFHHHLTCKDFTSTGQVFHVEQCDGCQLLLTNPRPRETDSTSYYKSTQYISHQSKATGIFDHIYLIIRSFTLNWKSRLVNHHGHRKKLLDYGCGTGAFLLHCKEKGFEAVGVEPSEEARSIANASATIAYPSLSGLPVGTYDAITLWHVMEHVYPLTETIQKLKSLLAESGTIFIAVPNWQSPDSMHYQQTWAGYDVPRHIWHFSKSSMTQLLEQHGLRIKNIIPMKLDAYYVSMLSEKYGAGGNLTMVGILRAIVQGLRSNRAARKTTNHSSLIYVVQK